MTTHYDLAGQRVWVAGHRGMVGSAVVRRLAAERCHVLTADRAALDLMRQEAVERFTARERPDVVVLAAARASLDALEARVVVETGQLRVVFPPAT